MAINASPNVKTLVRLWHVAKGGFGSDLVSQQNRPFRIALVGSDENRAVAASQLGIDASLLAHYDNPRDKALRSEPLVLNLGSTSVDSAEINLRLANLLAKNKGYRIAVAAQIPSLRPVVVDQIGREWAAANAKRATLDALPGILPGLDFLLPFTGAGDLVALTRNQIEMVLEIAACHDLAPDPKERLSELLPVIGSAFGWRAIARQLLTVVPFGGGVVVSGAMAYAGTRAVAKAVEYFYASGGKSLDLSKAVASVTGEAIGRAKAIAETINPRRALPPPAGTQAI